MESGVVSEATLNKCCQNSYVKNYTLHTSPSKLKCAFTLAEVLITLGVIGVVAALTMPTLIAKYQENVMINRLKQTYSMFSQALKMAELEHGNVSEWYASDADNSVKSRTYMDYLKSYIKVVRDCTGISTGCYNSEIKYSFNDESKTGNFAASNYVWAKGTLSNGIDFFIEPMLITDILQNTSIYSALTVDLNGAEKSPNKVGYDMFYFWITDKGIIPRGTPDSSETKDSDMEVCYSDHYTCTAWVLAHHNMDYWHCDDLSWTGKTKCD